LHCVRPAPKDLEDHFRKTAKRTVAKDRTVAIKGKLYEAPIELRGKQVTLLYHDHDLSRVEILREGKTYGFLTPLDVNVNCRVKRQQGITQIETDNTHYTGGSLFRKEKEK
jgi:hypothetical protein